MYDTMFTETDKKLAHGVAIAHCRTPFGVIRGPEMQADKHATCHVSIELVLPAAHLWSRAESQGKTMQDVS